MEKNESMRNSHLSWVNVAKHRIVLNHTDAPPVHSTPYRAGPKQWKLEREEIEKMRDADVAEPIVREWASSIVFVPKKHGSLEFCVDYRRLNAFAEKDSYSLPWMEECIDSLRKARCFWHLTQTSATGK